MEAIGKNIRDGSLPAPYKKSMICGYHFISGKPGNSNLDPDYVPTLNLPGMPGSKSINELINAKRRFLRVILWIFKELFRGFKLLHFQTMERRAVPMEASSVPAAPPSDGIPEPEPDQETEEEKAHTKLLDFIQKDQKLYIQRAKEGREQNAIMLEYQNLCYAIALLFLRYIKTNFSLKNA